jgi:hypothetical protein
MKPESVSYRINNIYYSVSAEKPARQDVHVVAGRERLELVQRLGSVYEYSKLRVSNIRKA